MKFFGLWTLFWFIIALVYTTTSQGFTLVFFFSFIGYIVLWIIARIVKAALDTVKSVVDYIKE